MTNILVRDLDPAVVEQIDRYAAELVLSRNELLRRRLTALATECPRKLTRKGLERLSYLTRDLLDDDVMRGAWE